jgi:hypothetical protein
MQLTLDQAARNPDRLAGIRRRSTRKALKLTNRERFEEWIAEHPDVYELAVSLLRQVKARGKLRYSMKAIFELIRWHYYIERGEEEFVLNNSYTSHMARLIEEREPDLAGVFEKRRLRTE